MIKNYLGPLYLTLAASIWGGMYVVSKVVLAFVPALELVWLRYIVALCALVVLGLAIGQSWHIRRQDIPRVLSVGIIGYFISIWAQFAGTQLSSAQMGAVITSATPAFMVLFARLLLKENITFRKGLSVFLATIGVLLIVGVGDIDSSFQLGGIFLLMAALSWALMSVMIKQIPNSYSMLVITTYATLAAVIIITPLIAGDMHYDTLSVLLEPKIWGGILYLGTVSTAGAFYFWNKGLQMVDASKGSLYFFFQPLVGTLLGWLFLGEQVGMSFWIGTLLIVIGVLLTIRDES